MDKKAAFHAATRFGYGLRGDELNSIAQDPRGWLMEQIASPITPKRLKEDMGGEQNFLDLRSAGKDPDMRKKAQKALGRNYTHMVGTRIMTQAQAEQPFTERMVWFWTNHFTISRQKKTTLGLALQYEREVVRKHLSGYFKEMLLASAQHPAMLFYLDNTQSVGPNSNVGKKRNRGLNENLAREILELHTLGVNGGYTQKDVTEFAKIITGWSIDNKVKKEDLRYKFNQSIHEPGEKTLLGTAFKEEGEKEGLKAIEMLAAHPSTAKFIATKLVRHFVADDPPKRAVDELSGVFMDSGGHLPTLMKALVQLPEAWENPLSKFKNPYEYVASILRATQIEVNARQAAQMIRALHFDAFDAGSPAGFDDAQEAWLSPDAIMKRIELAHKVSFQIKSKENPEAFANRILTGMLSAQTEHTIEGAQTAEEGYALVLASPEFMRR